MRAGINTINGEDHYGTSYPLFLLSFLGHVALMVAFMWLPGQQTSDFRMPGDVYEVSLVYSPPPGKPTATEKAAGTLPKIETVKSEVLPVPEKIVSLAPVEKKPKPKTSLKKKTIKPEKVKKSAIDKIKKKVDESRPVPVTDAIDRLKEKVSQEGRPAGSQRQGKDGVQKEGLGVSGGTGKGGQRPLTLFDLYQIEIVYQVEKNWAFSEGLAGGNRNLETRVVFRVMPDGKIEDIRFARKSGNRFLDESAYRAIMKSDPVAPHPTGLRRRYVELGIAFTPEGVK